MKVVCSFTTLLDRILIQDPTLQEQEGILFFSKKKISEEYCAKLGVTPLVGKAHYLLVSIFKMQSKRETQCT